MEYWLTVSEYISHSIRQHNLSLAKGLLLPKPKKTISDSDLQFHFSVCYMPVIHLCHVHVTSVDKVPFIHLKNMLLHNITILGLDFPQKCTPCAVLEHKEAILL